MAPMAQDKPFLRATALHVGFAFVVMGGWAAFANRGHGPEAMALAGLTQGTLSGLITLVLKRGLEAGHARLTGWAARWVPPMVSCVTIAAVLMVLHRLAGTPEILKTIAVPWTVSTLYAFIYTRTLDRAR